MGVKGTQDVADVCARLASCNGSDAALQDVAGENRYMGEVTSIIHRIHSGTTISGKPVHIPLPNQEKERLQNGLIFCGLVNHAMSSGCNDKEIAAYISRAVEQGNVTRPADSTEGIEKVAAALCAPELEELELATMDSLVRIRFTIEK